MVKLFFLISGENKTLPLAELTAILEAEKHNFSLVEKLDQVIRLKSEINCIKSVYLRSAYTRVCALELFTCELNDNKIIKCMNKIDFSSVINENESFAVRIKRVRNYAEKSAVMDLERKIGRIILQNTKNTKVNLTLPDKIFVGILTSGKMVFGLKIATICPKPFFHPSAMPSKLARCMINLAHAKQNDLVLDPFCGTGSTLIEATLIGCRTLGLDAQLKMLKGCKKNLEYFNIKPEGLILADARKHPITKTNCVVTDPPYGRCCSTMNSTTKKIVEKVLFSVLSILNKGDRICIASPKSIRLSLVGKTVGYDHLESHFVYVHRSLTREIAVFKKK